MVPTISATLGQLSRPYAATESARRVRSEFSAAASSIGASIHATASKLGKLTQLAQSKSLFEDPTIEINELTDIIKQDLTALSAGVNELHTMAAQASRGSARQRAEHSMSAVESLKLRLADMIKEFMKVLCLAHGSSLKSTPVLWFANCNVAQSYSLHPWKNSAVRMPQNSRSILIT